MPNNNQDLILMDLITYLHDQFLYEAKQSPLLLSDLANLEKYISESYSERSLIELIQNADDANSTKFYISIINDDTVLVANNGDCFTEEDIMALCRSGSSTKKRKSNTIGYRGIGFKSIVNYTNNVHIYSGNMKFSFSKELTKKDLPGINNVPLVRIPHVFAGDKYIDEINKVIEQGYTTIFIFETKLNSLVDEIDSFDESCLLFLRNLETFISKTNLTHEINAKRFRKNEMEKISISTSNTKNDWLILTDEIDGERVNVSFLLSNDVAQKLDGEKAVIHSFMPTKNTFCIPCKINGDFSTDPSRTKIVIDEESLNVINNISKLFSKIVLNTIKSNQDNFKLISVISSIAIDPLSQFKPKNINNEFIECFKNQIMKDLDKTNVLIQPNWLSEKSFLEIYENSNKVLITETVDEKIIGLKELLLILGFEEPDYNITMKKASENKYSEDTRVDLVVKSVDKTRFTVSEDDKESIDNAFIIESDDKIIKTKDIGNVKPSKSFISKIENKLNDTNDLKWFSKKFNIDYEPLKKKEESIKESYVEVNDKNNIVSFKKKSNLTKWRSIETNVIEILKGFDNIKSVEDVSLMNVGYDAKAITQNNQEQYYEIKSVNNLGDPIKITNNEYTHAHKYKDKYYLAIASQQDEYIELCIIHNPIETLNLTKRIVQVEWICDEYEGKYLKTFF